MVRVRQAREAFCGICGKNGSPSVVVLTGSLVNAAAICRYIESLAPEDEVPSVRNLTRIAAHVRSSSSEASQRWRLNTP
jgi:ribosome-binding protein aMBF1 (putative translation factor)